MAIQSFSQFTEMQFSVLQELGNMGSGSAATALSTMIGSPTDISVPTVKCISLAEAKLLINKLSGATASLLISLSGDFKGYILHLMPFKFVESIIGNFFPGTTINNINDIDEMGWSVVREVANITSGAYVNALSQLCGMFIDISTPDSYADTSSEVMKIYPQSESSLCFVNNTMIINSNGMKANMLYFPELESIRTLMQNVGVEC